MPTKTFKFSKRLFDLAFSVMLLLILSPLLLTVALLVRSKLGYPVLFRQERPGLNAQPFHVLKFRTMLDVGTISERGATAEEPVSDADRLTPFGAWLRSTSLDELPELWNIVRGHMSFVGPRPLLMQYLPLYSAQQARRHLVRPGLTGLAQVNGRNAVSWPERLALDVAYVDKASFILDTSILIKTALVVVRRSGVNEDGQATMSPFRGDS